MADGTIEPPTMTLEDLDAKHYRELEDYRSQCKINLKSAKKSEKAMVDAKNMQGEYDMKARQREEMELLELQIEKYGAPSPEPSVRDVDIPVIEEEIDEINNKISKSKRKKDKKLAKEAEAKSIKNDIAESMANVKSNRVIEMEAINQDLLAEGLRVKEIASDGHCLYRSIADQLQLSPMLDSGVLFSFATQNTSIGKLSTDNVRELRLLASKELANNVDTYLPFLGLDQEAYSAYCEKVAAYDQAEWGGHVEVQALCACLNRRIWIYCADRSVPVIKMGEENDNSTPPMRISYHQHYYSLGEHYNSVVL